MKRINNLISEQDFYALKTLKVPVNRFSALTELSVEHDAQPKSVLSVHHQDVSSDPRNNVSYTSYTANTDSDLEDDSTKKLLLRETLIPNGASTQSEDAVHFLEKMDANINTIVTSAASREESLVDVTNVFGAQRISHYVLERPNSIWNTVDCGIHWRGILVCVLLVGIVAPLCYFIFFEYIHPSAADGT